MELTEPDWNFSEDHCKYNKFDPWLQHLSHQISIQRSSETMEHTTAYHELLGGLQFAMKKVDPLFCLLFKRNKVAYTGSSYVGLKINDLNEFDVNFVLDFPIECDGQIKVKEADGKPGHITLELMKDLSVQKSMFEKIFNWASVETEENEYKSVVAQLMNWTKNGYLSRSKVLQWLQSVVDKALLYSMRGEKELWWKYVKEIKRSQSGPAITLNVLRNDGSRFSVDLVPALAFGSQQLPAGMQQRALNVGINWCCGYDKWYAVPKGPKYSTDDEYWRISMYDQEKYIINGLDHFKPVIRMIKRLRDSQKWDKLASYYILTAFMWLIKDFEDPSRFQHGLGKMLMQGMKLLREMMRHAAIPFFWDERLNLVDAGDINREHCNNIAGRLTTIIQTFEKSLVDDDIDPMTFFGSTKRGIQVIPETAAYTTPDSGIFNWCSIL